MSFEPESGPFMPFGLPGCEQELNPQIATEPFQDIYLRETPFDREATKPYNYLIIGRRGAGKTALAQSLRFNPRYNNPYYVLVPSDGYHAVLEDMQKQIYREDDFDLHRLMGIWERTIWGFMALHTDAENKTHLSLAHVLDRVLAVLIDEEQESAQQNAAEHSDLGSVRSRVLDRAKNRPIIIAIDTLEKYPITKPNLLRAIAALIQTARKINESYSVKNIHIKVLMSGEIYPHLSTYYLENSLKSSVGHVFLQWKPKPLLRLIAYRFYRYLQHNCLLGRGFSHPNDWSNYDEVLKKIWDPYFGRTVTNLRGAKEHSFLYILRHTQMRPRQVIEICNAIAAKSAEDGTFPKFSDSNRSIVEGVEAGELELAKEAINAYSDNVEDRKSIDIIKQALANIPLTFVATELDHRAYGIKTEWRLMQELGKYSEDAFRSVLAELGIIGIVRKETDLYIQADFEYSLGDKLIIGDQDECVIHPMFSRMLRVRRNSNKYVLPFSADEVESKI